MVDPLFFAKPLGNLKVGDSFHLTGDEGKHAAAVRRMRVGESIQLTDGVGTRVSGKVSIVEGNSLSISIERISLENLPNLRLTLVQALAKGDRDELAVQAATELGAIEVIPWQANRSVSRWEGPKAEKGRARWQAIVSEAAKQSLRVWEPKVLPAISSKELIKLADSFDSFLVLDPTASLGITELGLLQGKVAIVVGPEGGIDEHELAQLEQAGAKRVHLGAGILRTSTAGLAAISYLVGSNGYWNSDE